MTPPVPSEKVFGLSISTLIYLLSQVGFPVFVSVYLLVKFDPQMTQLIRACGG